MSESDPPAPQTRRSLLILAGGVVALVGAGVVLPMLRRAGKRLAIDADPAMKPGESRVIAHSESGDNVLVIRRLNGAWVAFVEACPHLRCPIEYRRQGDREEIICTCHDGRFDFTGRGLAGPPRDLPPLQAVDVNVR